MRILSVDPSIDPRNFGWALFENGQLKGYGVIISGRMAKGQNRHYSIFNFGVGHAGHVDLLVIDWPAMTPFRSHSNFKGRGMNMKSLALNHQSIGALLAGIQMDDENILRWNSAKHRLDKRLVQITTITKHGLAPETPDHITDAIYRGEWLVDQLKIRYFKQIKEIE